MSPSGGNIFQPSFLDRLLAETGDSDHGAEADLAGPWKVQQQGEVWLVIAEGEDEPEVIATSSETAMILAALLPGVGRSRLVQLRSQPEPQGYPLVDCHGELLAHIRHDLQDLAHAAHSIECVRRAPLELARILFSTRGSSLERAGRILWAWDQASSR